MKNKLKYLVAAGMVAAAISGHNAAFAATAGTLAGTSVDNTVSVSFEVGGAPQTPPPVATNSFLVDRIVNFIVDEENAASTSVTAGQVGAAVAFTIENISNDTLDFRVDAVNIATGLPTPRGTDAFDVSNFSYFSDAALTVPLAAATLLNVAPDTTVTVYVSADIPAALANDLLGGVTLTAFAQAATTGVDLVNDTSPDDPNVVQTVFDPTIDDTDDDDYIINGPDLTSIPPAKFSRVVSDPVNGTTNPKAIPGAVIEYCITVTNDAGAGADATNVILTDDISGLPVNYTAGVGANGVGGPDGTGVCTAGAGVVSEAGGIVTGTIPTLAIGETRNLVFQVTIQ